MLQEKYRDAIDNNEYKEKYRNLVDHQNEVLERDFKMRQKSLTELNYDGDDELEGSEPEQLELFIEEEEPLPTWGEILADTETRVLVAAIILFLVLMIFW